MQQKGQLTLLINCCTAKAWLQEQSHYKNNLQERLLPAAADRNCIH